MNGIPKREAWRTNSNRSILALTQGDFCHQSILSVEVNSLYSYHKGVFVSINLFKTLVTRLDGLLSRLRPVEGARPPRFEVAEISDLQALWEAGRGRRIVK